MIDGEPIITFTQMCFVGCMFIFGPAFGLLTMLLNRRTRMERMLSFILPTGWAYAGWLVSGLVAIYFFPDYPRTSPGEGTASLFVIPGFITGCVAVVSLRVLALQDPVEIVREDASR